MSDSEDSTVTYTVVSSPFGGLSDIGSPGVDGPLVMPEDPYAYVVAAFQAPPSPDYVLGPKQAPPSLVYVLYVLEPVYLKFMPPEDDVLIAEEQPLLATVSPTADSSRYIPESDPEEDPEEDPVDYPANGGDDDDDDDESSDDNEDDNEDVEEDEDEEEEEEEHPASADSVPPPVHRVTARISIPALPPTLFWSEAEVDRLLAIRTPPPSPLTPLSSPLPQIPSPPLLVSSPLPVSPPPPASPNYPLGYRAAMIRLRAESPSTSHPLPLPSPIVLPHTRASVDMMRAAAPSTYILAPRSGILPSETPPSGTPPLLPIPAPTSSQSLLLPSVDHRTDMPEVCLLPQKRLCIAFGPRYEVGESSSATTARPTGGFRADYGFVATMDREIRRDLEREMLDTDEIIGDWMRHRRLEREARLSCEAWSRSIEASDIARAEVMSLRTIVLAQQSEIAALRAADHTRKA
ncbi:hypothetical protein Tco_0407557 [Tanacetum coccineum]